MLLLGLKKKLPKNLTEFLYVYSFTYDGDFPLQTLKFCLKDNKISGPESNFSVFKMIHTFLFLLIYFSSLILVLCFLVCADFITVPNDSAML